MTLPHPAHGLVEQKQDKKLHGDRARAETGVAQRTLTLAKKDVVFYHGSVQKTFDLASRQAPGCQIPLTPSWVSSALRNLLYFRMLLIP